MIDYARCRGKRCQQGPTSRFGSWGDLRVTLIHELGASRAAVTPIPFHSRQTRSRPHSPLHAKDAFRSLGRTVVISGATEWRTRPPGLASNDVGVGPSNWPLFWAPQTSRPPRPISPGSPILASQAMQRFAFAMGPPPLTAAPAPRPLTSEPTGPH